MTDIPTGVTVHGPDDDHRTTAQTFRRALAGMLEQTAPGVVKPGVLYAPGEPAKVSGTNAMEYTVQPGVLVLGRTNQGAYILPIPTQVTVATTPADTTNPRIDRIYALQPDPQLSETSHARIDVVKGTPAANPSLPAMPTGALELARKVIAAGATTTQDGAAFTNLPPIVTANLGSGMLAGHPVVVSATDPGSVPDGTIWLKG